MESISEKRWKEAQEYERKFWEKHKKINSEGYIQKKEDVKRELRPFIKLSDKTKILQIGSGPQDLIHHFEKGKLFAIDPQMNNYEKMNILTKNNVKNICGVGENLPFEDNYFDLILITNVLDHCKEPRKVLLEIRRCLKKKGIVYLETNIRPGILMPFLKLIWPLKFDTMRGHPHLFLDRDLDKLVREYQLKLLYKDHKKSKLSLKDIKSPRLFIQKIIEYPYTIIANKN